MTEKNMFDTYVFCELLYEKIMKKNYREDELYPNNWYSINDYLQKIDILNEAIDNNQLIKDTNRYKNMDDGCIKIDDQLESR